MKYLNIISMRQGATQSANGRLRRSAERFAFRGAVIERQFGIRDIGRQQASWCKAAHIFEHIAQMSEESSSAGKHSAEVARELDRLANEMLKIINEYKI